MRPPIFLGASKLACDHAGSDLVYVISTANKPKQIASRSIQRTSAIVRIVGYTDEGAVTSTDGAGPGADTIEK